MTTQKPEANWNIQDIPFMRDFTGFSVERVLRPTVLYAAYLSFIKHWGLFIEACNEQNIPALLTLGARVENVENKIQITFLDEVDPDQAVMTFESWSKLREFAGDKYIAIYCKAKDLKDVHDV